LSDLSKNYGTWPTVRRCFAWTFTCRKVKFKLCIKNASENSISFEIFFSEIEWS
jgi:hypothetical protein